RFCAERFRRGAASVREYEIEAELLHEFRRAGAQSPAYTSIVAAGANTCVLHYAAGDAELRPGELCLIDAGCELDGYASDVTRSDVHDVGDYLSLGEAPVEQPDGLGGTVVKKPSRILQAGMVVTLEPGLYVRPADGVPERFWNIGIRIEDDAVVTPSGCEL